MGEAPAKIFQCTTFQCAEEVGTTLQDMYGKVCSTTKNPVLLDAEPAQIPGCHFKESRVKNVIFE